MQKYNEKNQKRGCEELLKFAHEIKTNSARINYKTKDQQKETPLCEQILHPHYLNSSSHDYSIGVKKGEHAQFLLAGMDIYSPVQFSGMSVSRAAATAYELCANLYRWDSQLKKWRLIYFGQDNEEYEHRFLFNRRFETTYTQGKSVESFKPIKKLMIRLA